MSFQLVPADVYEQHLAKSVAQAENKIGNAFHCKTPDCRGWCIFEDNVNEFRCPVCRRTNCLTCQVSHQISHFSSYHIDTLTLAIAPLAFCVHSGGREGELFKRWCTDWNVVIARQLESLFLKISRIMSHWVGLFPQGQN